MEWIKDKGQWKNLLKRYYPAVLAVAVGIVLLTIPTDRTPQAVSDSLEVPIPLETRLETLLSAIDGAGRVQVLLTSEVSEETLYQTDQSGSGEDTVLVSGADRRQAGLIRRVEAPQYRGAVVVCQGADSAAVRLAVVQAVAAATGLGTDRITVLKMK